MAGFLAHVDALGGRIDQREHPFADQVVEHQHVGPGQQARGAQRQQLRVAGAGPHEGNPPAGSGTRCGRAGHIGHAAPVSTDQLVQKGAQGAGGRNFKSDSDGRRHGGRSGIMTAEI